MSDPTGTPRPDDPQREAGAATTPAGATGPATGATDPTAAPTGTGAPDPAASPATNAPDAAAPAVVPHAGLRYGVLRIAMLVTVGGLLYLVGMRGWLLLFTAVLVSAVLSFFVFMRQREAAARNLEAAIEARRHHGHEAAGNDAPAA
ncbi:MAG: DUF4229 domain-containing protein [Candidatus Nanopelagicales bacterium]|jgi:hypothetical protein|nr:DUF4229 domain-containing protein [Candidatus Nanopelagicales bacterium]